jgi:hypothetical protein
MGQRFEVTWADEVGAAPGAVWDAITRHCDGWLWPIGYEPRLGGAEVGLTPDGGTVTDWVPERHFSTTGPMEGGTNRVEYRLTPSADGTRTAVEFRHDGIVGDDEDLAVQYDACVVHTDLYRHSMAEYATHFAGRDATYVEVDAGEASQAEGSTARLVQALGLDTAAVGDEVTLAVPGAAPCGASSTTGSRPSSACGARTASTASTVGTAGAGRSASPTTCSTRRPTAPPSRRPGGRSWTAPTSPPSS